MPPMITNSTFCSLSRESKAMSFCCIAFSCFFDFENQIQRALVLFKPLLWC